MSNKEKTSVSRYILTRIPTLFTPPGTSLSVLNPKPALSQLTRSDWNYFFMGYFAWTIDAVDFFCVSATAPALAKSFDRSIHDITWGITLVLMTRTLGALIFGSITDMYGRKPTYLAVMILFCIIEIGTGFVQNYTQFLIVRFMFGICMGGCYTTASATALESQPADARSFLGGIFLPGYNLGYILAVAFYRGFEYTAHGWRALFWFSSAPPLLLFCWRAYFPEHPHFVEHKRVQREKALMDGKEGQANSPIKQFLSDLRIAISQNTLLFIYLVVYMSLMNFSSHASQDLMPTMLQLQLNFSANARTGIMIVINSGAILGGLCIGVLTEYIGRRLGVFACAVMSSALIYPAFFSTSMGGLMAGGLFMQFFVMGCWGITSVYIMELSPPAFRASFGGLAYQLGNLASSASSTIEAQISAAFPLGDDVYDYGKSMALFMTGVNVALIICITCGPEYFHRDFSPEAEARELGMEETVLERTELSNSFDIDFEKGQTSHSEN
uniref:MFS transporter n=1 Tax=Cyberlindnera americana TaxID=36016 RepID=A0A5P8N8P8_9ASCO|nr:MFS transporter [Cyberlindnera americana]